VLVNSQNASIITVPADLSGSELSIFYDEIHRVLESKSEVIAIDCSRLEDVVSSHIGALLYAHQMCSESGVSMRLDSPTMSLIRILKVLDLDGVLEVKDNPAATQLRQTTTLHLGGKTRAYADEFAANSKSVDEGLQRFLEYLDSLHLNKTTKYELRTVFYEIATNIRLHAKSEGDNQIVFVSRVEGSKIVMVFTDSGIPFDPTRLVEDSDEQMANKTRQIRGFGIPMIRKLTSSVSYNRIHDTMNILTVEKLLGK